MDKKLIDFYNTKFLNHEMSVEKTPELERRLIFFREFLRNHYSKRILDVGCSRGYLSYVTKNKGLYGIDVSKPLLKDVKHYKEIKVASIENIPYPNNYRWNSKFIIFYSYSNTNKGKY